MTKFTTSALVGVLLLFTAQAQAQPADVDALSSIPPVISDVLESAPDTGPELEIVDVIPAEPIPVPTVDVVDADTAAPTTPPVADLDLTEDASAGLLLSALLDAASNGHWLVFAGLLLMLLVWLANRLGLAAKVGRKAVPWVTFGLSLVTALGVGLASGDTFVNAVLAAVFTSGVAIALWELIAKNFTETKTDGTPRA